MIYMTGYFVAPAPLSRSTPLSSVILRLLTVVYDLYGVVLCVPYPLIPRNIKITDCSL